MDKEEKFADLLRKRKKEMKMNQAALATYLEVERKNLSRWLTSSRTPDPDTLPDGFAKRLGVSEKKLRRSIGISKKARKLPPVTEISIPAQALTMVVQICQDPKKIPLLLNALKELMT